MNHNLLITFLVASVIYNAIMSWIWNTYTVRAFLFFKAVPFALALFSLIYLLMEFGFIVRVAH